MPTSSGHRKPVQSRSSQSNGLSKFSPLPPISTPATSSKNSSDDLSASNDAPLNLTIQEETPVRPSDLLDRRTSLESLSRKVGFNAKSSSDESTNPKAHLEFHRKDSRSVAHPTHKVDTRAYLSPPKKPQPIVRNPSIRVADAVAPEIARAQLVKIFELFSDVDSKLLDKDEFLKEVTSTGLDIRKDPRLKSLVALASSSASIIDIDQFSQYATPCIDTISRALSGKMILPNFPEFSATTSAIINEIDESPDVVTICSVDGQMWSHGHADTTVCMQELSHCVSYLIARDQMGRRIHDYIGREYNGFAGNALVLDEDGKPHNPLIDVGGMTCCSLLFPTEKNTDRYQHIQQRIRRMVANLPVHFNNDMYAHKTENIARTESMAYFLKEKNDSINVDETTKLYLQAYSIEMNMQALSVLAATIANYGVCPMTGDVVFHDDAVRDLLATMYVAGMDLSSGEFAFKVGYSGKSSHAGVVMCIVPGVMGICTLEPLSDNLSEIMGKDFFREFSFTFPFGATPHPPIPRHDDDPGPRRIDCRYTLSDVHANFLNLWLSIIAVEEDISEELEEHGHDDSIRLRDHFGRSLLHYTAIAGKDFLSGQLIESGIDVDVVDVFGKKAVDYMAKDNAARKAMRSSANPAVRRQTMVRAF